MFITNEDIELINAIKDKAKKGYTVSGTVVTDLHNRILGTTLRPTNCGTCIRQRWTAVQKAYDEYITKLAVEEAEKAAKEAEEAALNAPESLETLDVEVPTLNNTNDATEQKECDTLKTEMNTTNDTLTKGKRGRPRAVK